MKRLSNSLSSVEIFNEVFVRLTYIPLLL